MPDPMSRDPESERRTAMSDQTGYGRLGAAMAAAAREDARHARLSHDRGADAGRLGIIAERHKRGATGKCVYCLDFWPCDATTAVRAALSVPAPTLPALDALRELSEKATPGPWRQDSGVHDNVVRAEGDFDWVGVAGRRHDMPEPVFSGQVSNRAGQHVADAALIVAVVNWLREALRDAV